LQDNIINSCCSPNQHDYAGMKITASHGPKSVHIARLAVQFTPQSVIMARREVHMRLQSKSKWLQVLEAKGIGIELEWRLKNEAVKKASVKGDVPQVAMDLYKREHQSITMAEMMATC